jgi:ATP-binding protein involved in chromosome partitioning
MKRVCVPVADGKIFDHFGHAPQFAFFDVDPASGHIGTPSLADPPPHEPGILPEWLAAQRANVVLVGRMGGRAKALLEQCGIEAVTGVTETDPYAAVAAYARGELESQETTCDHGQGGCHAEDHAG